MIIKPDRFMSALEFDQALAKLGWSDLDAAEHLHIKPELVQRLADGRSMIGERIATELKSLLAQQRDK